jgi:hypothetical protein
MIREKFGYTRLRARGAERLGKLAIDGLWLQAVLDRLLFHPTQLPLCAGWGKPVSAMQRRSCPAVSNSRMGRFESGSRGFTS